MNCSDALCGSSRRSVCDVRSYLKRFERNDRRRIGRWAGALAAIVCASIAANAGAQEFSPAPPAATALGCDYQSPEKAQAAIRAAVEAGEIADPSMRVLPQVAERTVVG